jgi:hypothetical protein
MNINTSLNIITERVLALLNLALVSKSDTSYSDQALRALFRLNNHNYVINALRRSSLMELLLLAEPTAEQTYQDLLARDRTNYVTSTFAKARSHIENHNDEPGLLFPFFPPFSLFLSFQPYKNSSKLKLIYWTPYVN